MVKDEQLTPEAQEQLQALTKGKTNAFDLLVQNYKSSGEIELSSALVVARLQAQYFALSRTEALLKTANAWGQNEYNEPNEVNFAIPAVVTGKYSSFALKDIHEDFEINYPLDNDYADVGVPFAGVDIPSTQLNIALRNVEEKLGLSITQSSVASQSTYKSKNNFARRVVLKIKNIFLKLAKKPPLVASIFEGKITLQTQVGGYNVSNVEKLIKVYDMIFKKSILREAQASKKATGKKVPEQIQYAARLFADVLMARVNDFGSVANNQKAEQCLWLQFAGVLNRYNFNSEELKQITTLGTSAVASTCQELGITKEKIILRMTALGYSYSAVPADITQALLNVKERDYNRYAEGASDEVAHETDDPVVTGITDAVVDSSVADDDKDESAVTDTVTEVTETDVTTTETDDETTTDVVDDSTTVGETRIVPVGGGDATDSDETSLVDTTKTTNNIKASTVEKSIDKIIVKFLSDVATALADKIDAGKLKGKSLEKAHAQLRLYNLTLSYYVKATNSRSMTVKDGEYTESEISKARMLVKGLIKHKTQIANMVVESTVERREGQTPKSYINAVCKSNLNYSLRDYFLKLIKGCIDYCVAQQFGTGKKKATETTADDTVQDEIMGLLNEAETAKPAEYVPDFVIVEDGALQTPYKPNFVVVGEPVTVSETKRPDKGDQGKE